MSQIYDNQKRVAHVMFIKWLEKRKPILLVAQCQSGKTGAMLGLCDELIKMENNWRGEPVQDRYRSMPQKEISLFLIGPSDNALKAQTLQRFKLHKTDLFEDSYYGNYIWNMIDKDFAHCKLESPYFSYSEKGYYRDSYFQRISDILNSQRLAVILFDECHIGAGRDATIDNLAARKGICLGKNVLNKGCKENELIVLCSATPGTQTYGIKASELVDKYHICYLKPGAGYYGVSDFLKDGRVNSCFRPDKYQDRFIEEVVNPFLNGEPGSFILRLGTAKTYEKCNKIFSYLKSKNVSVTQYSSDKDNISDLCQDIYSDREKHSFRIIYQSYKQGQTLAYKISSEEEVDCRNYIRGWFDKDNNDNLATHIQSVGRNFGYGISDLTYPIWCNESYLKDSRDYYEYIKRLSDKNISDKYIQTAFDGLDRVMSNTHSSFSGQKTTKRGFCIAAFDSKPEAREFIYKRSGFDSYQSFSQCNYIWGLNCYENDSHDIASEIFRGTVQSQEFQDGHSKSGKTSEYGIIDFTRHNDNYKDSFKSLSNYEDSDFLKVDPSGKFGVIYADFYTSEEVHLNSSAYSDEIMSHTHSTKRKDKRGSYDIKVLGLYDNYLDAENYFHINKIDLSLKQNTTISKQSAQDVAEDLMKGAKRLNDEKDYHILDCTSGHLNYPESFEKLKFTKIDGHILYGKFAIVTFEKRKKINFIHTNNSSYAK